MKKSILMAKLSLMAMLLAGCGGQKTQEEKTETAGEKSPVKLTYWYAWTDKIQENNINLTKKFNETVGKEKGIFVEAEYQGTYDDLHQKLQAAHIAGTTPAVTIMEIASTKAFAEGGVLEPLSKYINRDGVKMDDFYEGLLLNSRINDEYYAIPYLRSTPILYMNATLLEKAGLDPKGPENWEELEYYAKTIKEKLGIYGLSMFSYIWTFEAFMLQRGLSILTPDEKKSNLNTPEVKEILETVRNMKDKGYIRTVSGGDSKKIEAEYMNQQTAMWFNSTANLTKALSDGKENGFTVNTSFIPKKLKYGVPTGGGNLIMTKKISAQEKEAAWEFIKWMTETDQAVYSSQHTGYLPTRKTATGSEKIQNLFKETPQFKVALDQLEYAVGRPMNPAYAEASREIVAMLDAVWVNGADIDTTLEKTAEKVDKILSSN